MQLSHPWMTEKRGLRGLTWLSGTAGICDFVGSFPPFTSPTSSQPFTRQKRERGEVERERSEFHFFLLWTRKWQQPSLLNHHQPTSLGPRIHVPSEKFPEFQMLHNHKNSLWLAKPHRCESTKQIIVRGRGQCEAGSYPPTWD
jgi:hypothetical protein